MSFGMDLRYHQGGVFLPEANLWMDPHEPVDLAFVSHAHSDHIQPHKRVIVSEGTSRLMQARMPGKRVEHICPFGTMQMLDGIKFELFPAGHIFGSSQIRLHLKNGTLSYTGDFKLREGRSAEPIQIVQSDFLIMETTFGRPHYVFPPTHQVIESVVRFCRETLNEEKTPVLLGYSLGKSQEILCSLAEAGIPIQLHPEVFRLTEIYRQMGIRFPEYEPHKPGAEPGKVLICPPGSQRSALLARLEQKRVAVLTGWAMDPGCRFRYQCDAAFPLSDHADFNDLVAFVRQVKPRQVFTLHGFATEFANVLRDMGISAIALSQEDQLELSLGQFAFSIPSHEIGIMKPGDLLDSGPLESTRASSEANSFLRFSEICRGVCSTTKKLEKVAVLANYFPELDEHSLYLAATYLTGRPFSAGEGRILSIGWAAIRDASCEITGMNAAQFHQTYLRYSDLGDAVEDLLKNMGSQSVPRENREMLLPEVHAALVRLHEARGSLKKVEALSAFLRELGPLEAKYFVKIITGDLRIGLKEGLVEDAIAVAFKIPPEKIRNKHMLTGDLGEVAAAAKSGRLENIDLKPFRAIKFMLASPQEIPSEIVEWSRGDAPAMEAGEQPQIWIEEKYDGIRCQLHRQGLRVELYSRDLKRITDTFPELVQAARDLSHDVIFDGEILAFDLQESGRALSFFDLQKRLGRKEIDLFMQSQIPISYIIFDLLTLDGKSLLERPLRERRLLLEGLELPSIFQFARVGFARNEEDILSEFRAARERNHEGLMIKDPDSTYTPGRRGLAWLKFKKALATLDCVIVGAEYGHGKRNAVISDYTFAVRDERDGSLKTIGKAYSGLTDEEIAEMTRIFLKDHIRQHGRYFEVAPKIVLEIAFDSIQRSKRHNSGFALRFPRIKGIRKDKTPDEIDTRQNVETMYRAQTYVLATPIQK